MVKNAHVGDGNEQDDNRQQPESPVPERLSCRQTSLLGQRLPGNRRLPAIGKKAFIGGLRANDENRRRNGEDADDQTKHEIGGLPAVVHDDPVGQGIENQSADPGGGKDNPHRQSPLIDEPVGDHHGYGYDVRSRAADA